ncbi:MAG: branched-chain amino acid transaminase [Dehalococcoidia bacterium]
MPTPTAYFQGQFVPLGDAKIGIRTHAFLYGTACFEGIRGNWNADDGKLYIFRLREHYERLRRSCHILHIELRPSDDELCELTSELAARNGYSEDVYIRPIAYQSEETIRPRMHDVEQDFLIFLEPFGDYLDLEKGIRCMTSTWRRVDDLGIPARAKVNGLYINSALARTEAQSNGFDEGIMLDDRGHVSEGTGENIVIMRKGKLVTPAPSDNILEGITLDTVITLARDELGIETVERSIDRSELYIADECFMTGTAAHVTAVTEVDRRAIGTGEPGEITRQLQRLYFDAMRGKNPKYAHWVTPVTPRTAAQPAGRQGQGVKA